MNLLFRIWRRNAAPYESSIDTEMFSQHPLLELRLCHHHVRSPQGITKEPPIAKSFAAQPPVTFRIVGNGQQKPPPFEPAEHRHLTAFDSSGALVIDVSVGPGHRRPQTRPARMEKANSRKSPSRRTHLVHANAVMDDPFRLAVVGGDEADF